MYKLKYAHTDENAPVEDRMDRVLKSRCEAIGGNENDDDEVRQA